MKRLEGPKRTPKVGKYKKIYKAVQHEADQTANRLDSGRRVELFRKQQLRGGGSQARPSSIAAAVDTSEDV